MNSSSSPAALLKSVFGYNQFKPLQEEVIHNVLQKRDTLVVMPTGGGKSLCYQIPALIFPGLTVVVTPLIALMKDQVEQLQALGVAALFLNSSLPAEEYQEAMQRVRSGEIKLLYVAPESLLTKRVFSLLSSLPFDCLTIDEAHCISEWGHDFRPEYRQLVEVRNRFPQAVCLALTATATPRVRQDIQACLHFEAANEFIASFNRENLFLEVLPKVDPLAQMLEFLERVPNQSGIIYCFARNQVDRLAEVLTRKGLSVRPYHAGLANEERKTNQELFIRDDVQIIVATIAFGMGINKPNVRFVVHYDLPKSVEGYYQEIGRAGRDGLPAHCLLLFSYGDVQKLKFFMDDKDPPQRLAAQQQLKALIRYAESEGCRRKPLLEYFGEQYSQEACGMCDHCLAGEKNLVGDKNLVDMTIPAQKFLSCVKRTGEKFGAAHIAAVLKGSKKKRVLQFEHHKLSTYGIGKDLDRRQWQYIARQLVHKGLLLQDDVTGGLKLTPKAYEVLRSHETILGVLHLEEVGSSKAGQVKPVETDGDLFEVLRRKRKELADAASVPPYVVFSDKTLTEMAAYYPMSPAAMLKINGIGQVKFQRYGQIFIGVIQAYCQPLGMVEKPREASQSSSSNAQSGQKPGVTPGPVPGLKPQDRVVGEAYNAGRSIFELAEAQQVQVDTILGHLFNYARAGNPLRPSGDFLALLTLPPEQLAAGMQAFSQFGGERLKPVFEALGEAVNYDQLKILRLHWMCQQCGR